MFLVLSTYFFCLFLYRLLFILKGYIPGICWFWWTMYFWFLLLCARQAAQPVCLRAIQAPAHALNQITLNWQVYSLLLGSTLVSAWVLALGDSAADGQLHPTRSRHDQLSAHQQHQPQPATRCALQTGVWRTWASSHRLSCQWQAAKYLSNPAKFKFGDFIREIKQRADLAWSWAVQMEMRTFTMNWDWNVAYATAKTFKQSCRFHILIINHWWNHYSSSWFIGRSPQQLDQNQISIWRTSDRVSYKRSSNLIDLIEKWNKALS